MFLDEIRTKGYQSVAIIGMAKNVGKTTVFNHLLRQCFEENYQVGLASIGRDGEKIDSITGEEKPSIWVAVGTIIAAAKQAIINSSASVEILEDTGFSGALGQIYLARVRRSGEVEIATTPSAQKMRNIIIQMKQYGAKLVLVDGALDRTSFAAPEITEGAILATGAAVNKNLDQVVKKTIARVEQLTIPSLGATLGEINHETLEKIKTTSDSLLIGNDGEITAMDKKSLGYEKNLLDFIKGGNKIKAVYIHGAVVDSLLEMFVANRRELQNTLLVVKNGTNILVSPNMWVKYIKAHGQIKAVNQINLIGITCNPMSPRGESFSPEEFLGKLADGVGGIVTVDVISGLLRRSGGD